MVHGAPPITLRVHVDDGLLRVEVADADPQVPAPPREWSPDPEGGRGLLLVASLATSWGADPDRSTGGKVAWFELRGTT